ncbi:hypothetical protein FRX31_007267, partial [Thalictrum thalictroides]
MKEITSSSGVSGNFTAVSPDAEVIRSFRRLRKKFDLLSAEMRDVIHLQDDMGRRGEPQMGINWLNNVSAREGELVDLQKKFIEIRTGGGTNIKACQELNKEVIACLKAVIRLKREANHNVVAHRVADSAILEGSVLHSGDSSSRSFKTVLKHLTQKGTISFSPDDLRSYTDFSTALDVSSSKFADERKYMPVPSERSLQKYEHMSVELPRVDFEMKNQENKDIKPKVKKDEVTTVVLKVYMHCEACAQKIKENLVNMEGVLTADADQEKNLVTVKCAIDPNKLVDRILEKNHKHAVIVKPEPEKKQEKKDVELGTVETKYEGKGAAAIKLKNKDKEKQGLGETRSEGKGSVEIKLKKKVEEIRIPNTEQEKEKNVKAEKKNKKRAVIVKAEPEKKQEEKDVEPGKKKEVKKEEGVDVDTVKSEGKGDAEIKPIKKDEASS